MKLGKKNVIRKETLLGVGLSMWLNTSPIRFPTIKKWFYL